MGEDVIVIGHVKADGCSDLLEIGDAGCLFGSFFCSREYGEQECRQNCNDGNHDKELDHGEGSACFHDELLKGYGIFVRQVP